MIKARYALLLLPLAMVACSSTDDDDDTAATDTPGSATPDDPDGSTYQIIFTNTSESQPMTPPVVAIHDPEVDFYEVGESVSAEVRAIAEKGETNALRDLLVGMVGNGVASTTVALSVPGTPGLIPPGDSATVTLSADSSTQVLSFVSMIVCSNDGFTGVDARALNAGVETLVAENFDAGSEVNTPTAAYWVVDPCGGEDNLHEDQNGVITVHEGQQPTGDAAPYAFPAGAELMGVTITRN